MPTDDAFVAEFTLASPDIRALAELVPTVELRLVEHYTDRAGTSHGIFWVRDDDAEQFEAALARSPIVDSCERLVTLPTRWLYDLMVGEGGDLSAAIEVSHEHSVVWQAIAVHRGRLFVRAIVPSRAAFGAFRREVRAFGYEFNLERASSDIEPALTDGVGVSSPQREAIVLAYERGYFREPREVTLEEIGEELGISESAVSGRLRRGLSQVIADCLDMDRPPAGSASGT